MQKRKFNGDPKRELQIFQEKILQRINDAEIVTVEELQRTNKKIKENIRKIFEDLKYSLKFDDNESREKLKKLQEELERKVGRFNRDFEQELKEILAMKTK